jgi:hypothetical protein
LTSLDTPGLVFRPVDYQRGTWRAPEPHRPAAALKKSSMSSIDIRALLKNFNVLWGTNFKAQGTTPIGDGVSKEGHVFSRLIDMANYVNWHLRGNWFCTLISYEYN